jgi:hypothetical protein
VLLVADPDRAEGASTHNLEDGQRNGRRELFRNVTGNIHHPRRACTNAPFQVAEVGASAQREPVNRRASQPHQGFCPSSLKNRFGSSPASGGPPLGGRAGERSECFCAFASGGGPGEGCSKMELVSKPSARARPGAPDRYRFRSYCRIENGQPGAAPGTCKNRWIVR